MEIDYPQLIKLCNFIPINALNITTNAKTINNFMRAFYSIVISLNFKIEKEFFFSKQRDNHFSNQK